MILFCVSEAVHRDSEWSMCGPRWQRTREQNAKLSYEELLASNEKAGWGLRWVFVMLIQGMRDLVQMSCLTEQPPEEALPWVCHAHLLCNMPGARF